MLAAGEAPLGWRRGADVPYPLVADWTNTLRVQVGGLAVVDVNGDGADDLVVGCYHSDSFPPYDDWENLIYLNRNGVLDSMPSWTFDSPHVGTAIAFGDINGDDLPDLVVGNSGDTSIWVFYNTMEPPLFTDGFESGDTSGWTLTVP